MSQEVYVKKEKLEQELKRRDIRYTIEEREDDIVFYIEYTLYHQNITVALIVDNTVYHDCYIYFGELEDGNKREQILNLMNELNSQYRIEKFVLLSANNLVLSCSYITEYKNFDAPLFIDYVFFNIFQLKDEHLKKFMKILWS